MADNSVPTTLSDDDATGPLLASREIPAAPKAAAIKSLKEKLVTTGLPEGAAAAIARATADPADFRRRLDRPTPVRVPGAVLYTVEADMFAPAVVPYIANYREADSRVFPADVPNGAGAPEYAPIRRPKGDRDGAAVLDIELEDRGHLQHALDASIGYLVQHNKLTDTIAERGVMFPVAIVATKNEIGGSDIYMPATVDGSSRTANALEVLGLKAKDILGPYMTDQRTLPGLVGRLREVVGRSIDEVSEDELAEANALVLPARVIVKYEPDASGNADFAKAVHNYVALIHGDLPPKPWPETARIDAKADSVVAELEQDGILTPNQGRYFEGMLDPATAKARKLPQHADARALYITSKISDPAGGVHKAIRRGVVQSSDRKKVTKGLKAELAAELSLRAARSRLTPKDLSNARDVYANVITHPAIWEQRLKVSGLEPRELLERALNERKTGEGGPATAELGALGTYWLVVHRALRDPRFFASQAYRDGRAASAVIGALMDSERGLRQLARAIEDGRDGDPPWTVKEDGTKDRSGTGEPRALTNDILREEVAPSDKGEPAPDPTGDETGEPKVPAERLVLDRRKALEAAVTLLEERHAALLKIEDPSGTPIVVSKGIPKSVTEELRDRLEELRGALFAYGMAWEAKSESDDGGINPSEDEDEGGDQ